MADEEGKTGDEAEGSDEFDPKTLSKEGQEYIRKQIQSESDSKSQLVETRLRAEVAQANRSAVETAQENEIRQLAETGQAEAIGNRVIAKMSTASVERTAITGASDMIERQMSEAFSESLGPERVEQIRRQVVQEGGAHAEFAKALAKAEGGDSRAEEIAAEVKAQMLTAGVGKRDEQTGADKASESGQGSKLSTFEEIEQAYTEGNASRETYEAARKAR